LGNAFIAFDASSKPLLSKASAAPPQMVRRNKYFAPTP